ncbi:TolC family outer membrane protein [Vreelandella venusta]|uniref:TolC family outer membrane protein n=1 Tax=Vreelandella venusta TaxID=44935 RepID=A0AAP9ZFB9_9GAMM|nr:TolC family outer membrane protein [Halomonas venusta]MBR9925260.1 TolC family outer membrane protein [Gammaproteobacteria bacterium]MDW0361266.1 TolC family outer membrane protein [Halomonas venusta]MDX1355006.1 TolC family outer membrane protein [Halomonas venusta]MDX1714688.1 TolC family outer membrane protein [Halomonas venusta]QRL04325.1 TolC family outer membrane protein [Halomonas venusta]
MRLAHWAVNAPFRPLLLAVLTSSFVLPAQAADLVNITRDALNNNAALASARAEFSSVEAASDVASGALLPQVNASGNVVHNQQYESQSSSRVGQSAGAGSNAAGVSDDRYNTASLTLEATQALFNAVTREEVNQAERQIDQQVYLLAATEQQLLIDVASAYFDILRAHEVLEARLAQERAIGRQLEQAREQFEVGLIAITEVEEARASFDQSRADRIAAESNLQVAFEVLEQLTGQRYASIDALGDSMPIALPTPTDRNYWVEQAIERNPQVLAQQAGIELSRVGVELARAGRMPTVQAFANYQYSDSDSDLVSGYNTSSQVGVSANLPIYTGGSTSARIRQGTFQLESSQYNYESQRRTTIQQVRSLYTQVSNNVDTVEARQQAIVSNRSALEATRAGYEVGTRNIVDVLNAEQSLYNAIANYAEARYDYVVNLLSLRQQAGLLDVEAIEEVNAWLTGDEVNFTLPEGGDPDAYQRAMDIGAPPTPGA